MSLSAIPTLAVVLPLTSRDIGLADQGDAYVVTSGVPGTGIIGFATTTTFAIGEANPYLYLYNPGPATIYPAYLRMQLTVVPTASTNMRFTHTLDVGNKQTTIATALTPKPVNPASVNSSKAAISIGANVCNAPSTTTREILGSQLYRNSIGIVNDTYTMNFGQTSIEPLAVVATYMHLSFPYVQPVIPPGYNWSVVFWAPSTSAGPTLEVEMGYFEK